MPCLDFDSERCHGCQGCPPDTVEALRRNPTYTYSCGSCRQQRSELRRNAVVECPKCRRPMENITAND